MPAWLRVVPKTIFRAQEEEGWKKESEFASCGNKNVFILREGEKIGIAVFLESSIRIDFLLQ